MTGRRRERRPGLFAAALAVLGLLLLLPADAWAWGPSTHVLLGRHVLDTLAALPAPLRDLLVAAPYEFLYGNLSADITLAKRYVHYSRHCHRWDVGFELLHRAETPRLRSFALGYLSHLAADTLAHNVFVPRQLLLTASTARVGHAYWEVRFDSHLPPEHVRLAREIVMREHTAPDALLETVLTQPVFSFRTNKLVFQRMIHLSNDERWQRLFQRAVAQSRWDLSEEDVERYLAVARHLVVDFLGRGAGSRACGMDPIGNENLRLAKKIRRRTLHGVRLESGLLDARRRREEVSEMAEMHFAIPALPLSTGAAPLVTPGDPPLESVAGFWNRFASRRDSGDPALVAGPAAADGAGLVESRRTGRRQRGVVPPG